MKPLRTKYKELSQRHLLDLTAKKSTNSANNKELVERFYREGADLFINAVVERGYTERGKKVTVSGWFREVLTLIGTLKVHDVFVSGAAQCGKTLSCTLLQTYLFTELNLNILGVFDKSKTMERNVSLQFKPITEKWLKVLGKTVDKASVSLWRFNGANAIFSYVSTSRSTSQRQGLASAGSAVVSVTADILFTDERSQFPPGTADPLPRRLDASVIPSKPTRNFGTPGSGAGIEKLIASCDYNFYPHVDCEHCGASVSLHPLGALFLPVEKVVNGKTVIKYFGESGRPLKWFCHDANNPVKTAYIGCSQCQKELSNEVRKNAYFKCLKTGVLLKDFVGDLHQNN